MYNNHWKWWMYFCSVPCKLILTCYSLLFIIICLSSFYLFKWLITKQGQRQFYHACTVAQIGCLEVLPSKLIHSRLPNFLTASRALFSLMPPFQYLLLKLWTQAATLHSQSTSFPKRKGRRRRSRRKAASPFRDYILSLCFLDAQFPFSVTECALGPVKYK